MSVNLPLYNFFCAIMCVCNSNFNSYTLVQFYDWCSNRGDNSGLLQKIIDPTSYVDQFYPIHHFVYEFNKNTDTVFMGVMS